MYFQDLLIRPFGEYVLRRFTRLENLKTTLRSSRGSASDPAHYLNEDKAFQAAMKAVLLWLHLDGQMLPGHIQPFNLSAATLSGSCFF